MPPFKYHLPNGKVVFSQNEIKPDQMDDFISQAMGSPSDDNIPDEGPEVPAEPSLWEKANTPLVNVSPTMRQAMREFGQAGPNDTPIQAQLKGFGSGALEGLTDLVTGNTSPLQAGLGILGAGSSLGASGALRAVLPEAAIPAIESASRTGLKIGSAGLVGHGVYQIGTGVQEGSLPKIGGGLVELAGGATGLQHGPNMTPDLPATPKAIPSKFPSGAIDLRSIDLNAGDSGLKAIMDANHIQRDVVPYAPDMPLTMDKFGLNPNQPEGYPLNIVPRSLQPDRSTFLNRAIPESIQERTGQFGAELSPSETTRTIESEKRVLSPDLAKDLYDRTKNLPRTPPVKKLERVVEATRNETKIPNLDASEIKIDNPTDAALKQFKKAGYKATNIDEKGTVTFKKLVKQAKVKPSEITVEPEGPLFAVSDKGGIKRGANVTRATQHVKSNYSSDLSGIMIRESMQNAIDAIKPFGDMGKIGINISDTGFNLFDSGHGLTREQLETVYSDIYSTGKEGDPNASGGKGIGKVSYQEGGKRFKLVTVAKEPNGQLMQHTIEATPEMWSDNVPIESKPVPRNTPTGTRIEVDFPDNPNPDRSWENPNYVAKDMLRNISMFSRDIPGTLHDQQYSFHVPEKFKSTANDTPVFKGELNGTDIAIYVPDGESLGTKSWTNKRLLNNGMYQASEDVGFGTDTDHMPANVLVDVRPRPEIEEGDVRYPWTDDREHLKDSFKAYIDDAIKSYLSEPQQKRKKNVLRELYQSMPVVQNPLPTKRGTVIFDPGNRLTPEETASFVNSPITQRLVQEFDRTIDGILTSAKEKAWSEKLERTGIVLDPTMHGVHIPNPDTGKSTILINPFINIARKAPADAADETVVTALHEAAHIGVENASGKTYLKNELNDPRLGKFLTTFLEQTMEHGGLNRGHAMDWVHRMGKIYEDYGAQNALEATKRIESILTDNTGGYRPEVQRLLRLYQESRERPETTTDFLSGTGTLSEFNPRGKKLTPSNPEADPNGTVAKLVDAVRNAQPIRDIQEEMYSLERGKRIKAAMRVRTPGEAGFYKQLKKLKGPYEKVDFESIRDAFDQVDIDSLHNAIQDNPELMDWEKIRAKVALGKLLGGFGGQVPQQNEINLLEKAFGSEIKDAIVELHGGLGALNEGDFTKLFKGTKEVANLTKTLQASIDVSAPLRQGLPLAYTKQYREALRPMLEAAASEDYFQQGMAAIKDRPRAELGRSSGLKLTDIGTDIDQREEQFLSKLAEHIPESDNPILGTAAKTYNKTIGTGVRGSERAYVFFLDKLRSDLFDHLVDKMERLGTPSTTKVIKNGQVLEIPTTGAKAIARFVNVMSGRGSLGNKLPIWNEKNATDLNTLFFSPRLISARVQMFTNAKLYSELPPGIRIEGIKALATAVGGGALIAGLTSKVMGGSIDFSNPTSSDFGKARVGDRTRVDPYGGIQQYIVEASKQLNGGSTSTISGKYTPFGSTFVAPTRGGEALNFFMNKLSPLARFTAGMMLQRTGPGGANVSIGGRPWDTKLEALKLVIPLMIQDTYSIQTGEPDMNQFQKSLLEIEAALGAGVQTYDQRPSASNSPLGSGTLTSPLGGSPLSQ